MFCVLNDLFWVIVKVNCSTPFYYSFSSSLLLLFTFSQL